MAKKLAGLPKIRARQDIVRTFDYLAEKGNVSRISDLADQLREYAIETYGLPYPQALTRAIKELEK